MSVRVSLWCTGALFALRVTLASLTIPRPRCPTRILQTGLPGVVPAVSLLIIALTNVINGSDPFGNRYPSQRPSRCQIDRGGSTHRRHPNQRRHHQQRTVASSLVAARRDVYSTAPIGTGMAGGQNQEGRCAHQDLSRDGLNHLRVVYSRKSRFVEHR